MRRATSSVSCSLNWAGALRVLLSIWIATSALLRPGRLLVPAKITSSISAARSDLCEVSPITQRSASTRFDLPQPFGPTTPVSPGSIRKSVGSTKDLKPSRRSRVSFIDRRRSSPDGPARPKSVRPRAHDGGSSGGRVAASTGTMNRRARFRNRKKTLSRPPWIGRHTAGQPGIPLRSTNRKMVKKPLSALEIGGDLLVQFVGGQSAAKHLAVDEKGGGGIDVEFLRRARLRLLEGIEHLMIREAFVERLLGEAGLLGDGKHGLQRLLHHPILLLRKERLDQREKFVVAGTAREHGG